MCELDLFQRAILICYGNFLHHVKSRVRAVDDLAKDCMFAIQMRLLSVSNEKLRLVRFRVLSRIGHCDHASSVELADQLANVG